MNSEVQNIDETKLRYIRPSVDINEDENGINLYADMPGVKREQLIIETKDNKLKIIGQIGIEISDDYKPIKNEFRYNAYRREFTLSKDLDENNITANLKNGVLYLNIPKKEEVKPRKIEVVSE